MGFIKDLIAEVLMRRKIRKVEEKRQALLKELVEKAPDERFRREWADLEHQHRMLINPAYKLSVLKAEELNATRKKLKSGKYILGGKI